MKKILLLLLISQVAYGASSAFIQPAATPAINRATDHDDANTEYLTVADAADFSVGANDWAVVVITWSDDISASYGIVGKWPESGQSEWLIWTDPDNYAFAVSRSSCGPTTPGLVYATTDGTITTGQFNMVYAYYDHGTGTGIEINNSGNVDTLSYTTGGCDGTANFNIGWQGNASRKFDGKVAMVVIWKTGFPSQATLDEIWNSGSPETIRCSDITTTTNITVCFDLDESSDGTGQVDRESYSTISTHTLTDTNTTPSCDIGSCS